MHRSSSAADRAAVRAPSGDRIRPGSCLEHDPSADDVLLGTSLEYLEPDARGTWRSIALDRDEHLSSCSCSGHSVTTADGTARDDDLTGVGCDRSAAAPA